MNPRATLSVDLRRISYWLLNHQDDLAWQFLDLDLVKYKDLGLNATLLRLKTLERPKAVELAMTTSIILGRQA